MKASEFNTISYILIYTVYLTNFNFNIDSNESAQIPPFLVASVLLQLSIVVNYIQLYESYIQ